MTNVHIEFYTLDRVTRNETRKEKVRPGYEHVNVHMIFNIKIDGRLTRKAKLVSDGHITAPPSSITYSSVLSRESVSIGFILAYLNDL